MMKQSRRFNIVVFTALMLLIAAAVGAPPVSSAQPKGEPFVIGYIGMVASPGTRPLHGHPENGGGGNHGWRGKTGQICGHG